MGEDVIFVFSQTSSSSTISEAFFLMNGFEIESLGSILKAQAPSPDDGEEDVALDCELRWTAGLYAVTHDVYFGINFDDVNNASRDNPGEVLVSLNQSEDTFTPTDLEFGGLYYWRVDEVNASPTTIFTGDVWSFEAEPVAFVLDSNSIAATASSQGSADSGPEKTIDGSGLDALDQHSTESEDQWMSDGDERLL